MTSSLQGITRNKVFDSLLIRVVNSGKFGNNINYDINIGNKSLFKTVAE